MKKIWKKIVRILTFRWWAEWRNEAIESGAVSYEGQGRNKYGK